MPEEKCFWRKKGHILPEQNYDIKQLFKQTQHLFMEEPTRNLFEYDPKFIVAFVIDENLLELNGLSD